MQLLEGEALYREVVLRRLSEARESVWISTANVKAMMVEFAPGDFRPIVELFAKLCERGVTVRVLHAELPSRPFRAAFDELLSRFEDRLTMKICPRVHFKCVLVDGGWLYLGSANLTGAGLGAKHKDQRNFELGFVTEDFDAIDRTTALYESVWTGVTCKTCRLYDECPDPLGPRPAKAKRSRRNRASTGVVLGKSRRLGNWR